MVARYSEFEKGESSWLEEPQAFLPSGLLELHISNFSRPYIEELGDLVDLDEDPQNAGFARILSHAAPRLRSHERVCVSINMEDTAIGIEPIDRIQEFRNEPSLHCGILWKGSTLVVLRSRYGGTQSTTGRRGTC
jgi:hypothetical protein